MANKARLMELSVAVRRTQFLAVALLGAVYRAGKREGRQARRVFSGMMIYAAGFVGSSLPSNRSAKAAAFDVFGEKYGVTGEFVAQELLPTTMVDRPFTDRSMRS